MFAQRLVEQANKLGFAALRAGENPKLKMSAKLIQHLSGHFRVRVRTSVFLLVVALLASGAIARGQEGSIVREIVFRGLERIQPEELIPLLPVRVGQQLTQSEPGELLNSLNRALNPTGCLALEVLIETEGVEDGVRLVIVVRENPPL